MPKPKDGCSAVALQGSLGSFGALLLLLLLVLVLGGVGRRCVPAWECGVEGVAGRIIRVHASGPEARRLGPMRRMLLLLLLRVLQVTARVVGPCRRTAATHTACFAASGAAAGMGLK